MLVVFQVAFIQRENNAPSDSHSRISPDGWKNLGAAGQKLFSKNPPFHFMYVINIKIKRYGMIASETTCHQRSK